MGLFDILKQYTATGAPPDRDMEGHFDSVSQEADRTQLGSGIAAALRSDATPSFGQTIENLFTHSNSDQKAGVLNELMSALGPNGLGAAGSGILGRIMGAAGTGAAAPMTPEQANQISPADMNTIAVAAQSHDDSIVDRLGSFYAQHPMLVKSLGAAALGAVMSHMNMQQRA